MQPINSKDFTHYKENYRTIERPKTIYRTIEAIDIDKNSADSVINAVDDLIDDSKYKPYFFKRLYELGPSKFMVLADVARKGDNPSRLFTYLLNKER